LGKSTDPAAQREGLNIYEEIFTPQASIRVTGGAAGLLGTGPQAWAKVVEGALLDYVGTQHLIGTQLVTFEAVTFAADEVASGRARMTSYLHAWHAWPDRRVRLVLGTYHDAVVYHPERGWQIDDMTLEHISSEERLMGELS